MNRDDWRRMAIKRVKDAKVLLSRKRWSAAYYLAGYGVECGLKACVLVRVAAEPEVVSDDRRFSEKCWTHNLEQLVELANLKDELDLACASDPMFAENWELVRQWKEIRRYEQTKKKEAIDLYEAITNKTHGVLPWIQNRW